jgi:hypothetical protein
MCLRNHSRNILSLKLSQATRIHKVFIPVVLFFFIFFIFLFFYFLEEVGVRKKKDFVLGGKTYLGLRKKDFVLGGKPRNMFLDTS